jgi:hypothetical protein
MITICLEAEGRHNAQPIKTGTNVFLAFQAVEARLNIVIRGRHWYKSQEATAD